MASFLHKYFFKHMKNPSHAKLDHIFKMLRRINELLSHIYEIISRIYEILSQIYETVNQIYQILSCIFDFIVDSLISGTGHLVCKYLGTLN